MFDIIPILLIVLSLIIKIAVVIYAFIIPAKINRYLWYQEKHLEIQAAIARKAGISEEELTDILDGEAE